MLFRDTYPGLNSSCPWQKLQVSLCRGLHGEPGLQAVGGKQAAMQGMGSSF